MASLEHKFKDNYFKVPTWCDYCDGFIEGIFSQQGRKCKVCKYGVHYECAEKALAEPCPGSKDKMEALRRLKEKNRTEVELRRSIQKSTTNEDYSKKIYSIIDPTTPYSEWKLERYTLPPDEQFVLPSNLNDHLQNIDQNEDRYLYKFHMQLLELIQTEFNYNKKLAHIFHTWVKQLAMISHQESTTPGAQDTLPDVFNCMFAGFPRLYRKQIDRWRWLTEDIETYGVSLQALSSRFLPVDTASTPGDDQSETLRKDMSTYFFHCKNMKKDEYSRQYKQLGRSEAYRTIQNQPETHRLQLNDLLTEPFSRICRYPLLLSGMQSSLKRHPKATQQELDLINSLNEITKKLALDINDELRLEEERTLYAKVKYKPDLIISPNAEQVFKDEKISYNLRHNQDKLIKHVEIQVNDPSGERSNWTPKIHLVVCDTFVLFCKEAESEIDPNVMVYEVSENPHPTDWCEFRTLHDVEDNRIAASNFDKDTDLIFRARLPKPFQHVTTCVKGLRFADNDEQRAFFEAVYPSQMASRSSGSSSSRGLTERRNIRTQRVRRGRTTRSVTMATLQPARVTKSLTGLDIETGD